MTRPERDQAALRLGADVVKHLIPHRPPLLMVDSVRRYQRGARPTLWASRQISANEAVFAGHYPGLHLWPGVYTIEGLGQTGQILAVLLHLEQRWQEKGGDPDEVLQALRNLEQGYRLQPGFQPEASQLLQELRGEGPPMGMSGSVEIRFLEPVFAGCRLDYVVTLAHTVDRFIRFEVEAQVDGGAVARGIMTGVVGPALSTHGPPR
jgi:3-hydroxyacyl-[acyl-carrier-protein] dehydratase